DSINHDQDTTPITHREHYFSHIPKDGELAQFVEAGYWKNPPGYYRGVPDYQTYSFRKANLFRKYDEDWKNAWYNSAVKRLRSWRMNTAGAFYNIYLLSPVRRIPYTNLLTHSIDSRPSAGSRGHWVRFPDSYDSS